MPGHVGRTGTVGGAGGDDDVLRVPGAVGGRGDPPAVDALEALDPLTEVRREAVVAA